jgi:streptogramin lyase
VAVTATVEQPTPAPTAAASPTAPVDSPTPQPLLEAISATIDTGAGSTNVGAGAEAIWVPLTGDGTLARIDATTNEVVAIIDVGAAPQEGGPTGPQMDVALDGEHVWLAASLGTSGINAVPSLLRIDPATNTVVETFTISAHPFNITAGEGSLWVASYRNGSVLRVNPETGDVLATILLTNASCVTVGAGAVWVGSDGLVLQIHRTGQTFAGQPNIIRKIDAEQPVFVLPEVGFARRIGVIGETVAYRYPAGDDTRRVRHLNHLRPQRVVWWKNSKIPEIAVVTMHPEIIPRQNRIFRGHCWR